MTADLKTGYSHGQPDWPHRSGFALAAVHVSNVADASTLVHVVSFWFLSPSASEQGPDVCSCYSPLDRF